MTAHLPLTKTQGGCILAVHVTPKARKDWVDGVETDAAGKAWLRVRTTTPPEDGKATKAVVKMLAKQLKLPARALEVMSGDTSRYKRLHIPRDYEEIAACLKLL